MHVDLATRTSPAAVPARVLPTAALGRATDRLLDAAVDRSDLGAAAAWGAVAELADWCAVDLVRDERLERAAYVAGAGFDRGLLGGAVARFDVPDPMLLRRLQIAGTPVRIEDPDWLPRHRAVAAAIAGDGEPRGTVLALMPLDGKDLEDQLWFAAALGRRLGHLLECFS